MDKIETQNFNREQKKLYRERSNILNSKRNEINKIKNHFERVKEDQRIQGENDLIELKSKLKDQESIATENYLQKINKHHQKLQDVQSKLEKERTTIENFHKSKIKDLKSSQEKQMEDSITETLNKAGEINNLGLETLEKIKEKSNEEIVAAKNSAKLETIDKQNSYNDKLKEIDYKQTAKLRSLNSDFANKVARSQLEHDKEFHFIKKEQSRVKKSHEEQHKRELAMINSKHSEAIKSKESNFKKKFNSLSQQHQKFFTKMKQRLDLELNKLRQKHSSMKSNLSAKANDPFYNSTLLNYSTRPTIDGHIIEIPTTEWEKNNYQLSVNNREVTISFTRRYEEQISDKDKAESISKRSELITQKFELPDIMDKSSITKDYHAGKLIFSIKKS